MRQVKLLVRGYWGDAPNFLEESVSTKGFKGGYGDDTFDYHFESAGYINGTGKGDGTYCQADPECPKLIKDQQ